MQWYLPSFYGDIKLQDSSNDKEKLTTVTWEHLTPSEKKALASLKDKAEAKSWLTTSASDFDREMNPGGGLVLKAKIGDVQKLLAKALRPGRKLVSVVKFANGKLEEVSSADLAEVKDVKEADKKEATGTTVAKPTRGCPVPRLGQADLKARKVLFEFLSDDQMDDFEDHQQFVSTGAGTGHKYMVTSRNAPSKLAQYQGRQLYDLVEQRSFCIHHDGFVPAAEEMLTLHLMLQFPHHESYLRQSDVFGDGGYIDEAIDDLQMNPSDN
jgi:hypothetical protein